MSNENNILQQINKYKQKIESASDHSIDLKFIYHNRELNQINQINQMNQKFNNNMYKQHQYGCSMSFVVKRNQNIVSQFKQPWNGKYYDKKKMAQYACAEDFVTNYQQQIQDYIDNVSRSLTEISYPYTWRQMTNIQYTHKDFKLLQYGNDIIVYENDKLEVFCKNFKNFEKTNYKLDIYIDTEGHDTNDGFPYVIQVGIKTVDFFHCLVYKNPTKEMLKSLPCNLLDLLKRKESTIYTYGYERILQHNGIQYVNLQLVKENGKLMSLKTECQECGINMDYKKKGITLSDWTYPSFHPIQLSYAIHDVYVLYNLHQKRG